MSVGMLEYMRDLSHELAKLAAQNGFPSLAYIFGMAVIEAGDLNKNAGQSPNSSGLVPAQADDLANTRLNP